MSTLDTNLGKPQSKLENVLSPCLPSLLSSTSTLNHHSFILEPIIELSQDPRISSDTITTCCCREDYIYIGISSGVIMCYMVDDSETILKFSTSIGKHPIDHMEVIYGSDLEMLVVLSNNVVTLHNPKNLAYLKTVPVSNISMFCCNSGYPFCGLAVISGTTLHLYNLHYEFEVAKALDINNGSPNGICWIKDSICISYNGHYKFLNDITGRMLKEREAGTTQPLIKPLPHDEICITKNKTVSILDSSLMFGLKIKLRHTPTKFSFSFPYLISISDKETMIEIKNLVDPEYSQYISFPENLINLTCSTDDSKSVYLANNTTLYLFKTFPPDNYIADDAAIIKSIVLDENRNLFKKYVEDILQTKDTIYNRLLKEYIKRFRLECKYIRHDNSVEGIKLIVAKYIRKLYILLSLTLSKLIINDETRNKLYLCIYDIFHSSIYDIIMPHICKISATLDKSYLEKVSLLKPLSPSQFNIGKRYWLNEHSLLFERDVKRDTNPDDQNTEVFDGDNLLNNEDLILAGSATLTKTFTNTGEKNSELVKVFYDGYGIYILSSNGSYLTPKPIIDEDVVQYDENESLISWKEKDFSSHLVFESNQDFREFITQFRFYSHENKQSDSDAENNQKDMENYLIESDLTSKLKTLTLRFSNRELKPYLLKKSSSFDDGVSTSDINNGLIDYYKPAYTLLRTLPQKRSPRQKAICLSKVLDKIILCINEFWNPFNKRFNVIADDLVPILTYIVAKSEIPSINGELNYMIEFSNERSVHGKYSYSLATFQIALDSLKYIEKQPIENQEFLDIHSSGRYRAQILVNKLDNLHEKLQKESNSSGIENNFSKSSNEQSNKESSCTLS